MADVEASSQIESDYDQSNGQRAPLGARSQIQLAQEAASGGPEADQSRLEARERIKAKFRSRRAERLRQDPFGSEVGSSMGASSAAGPAFQRSSRALGAPGGRQNTAARQAGEEMYSHLDFYERSLRAVQK